MDRYRQYEKYVVAAMLILIATAFVLLVYVLWVFTRIPLSPIEWVENDTSTVYACPGDQIDQEVILLLYNRNDNPIKLEVDTTWIRANDHPDTITIRESERGMELQEKYGVPLVGDTVVWSTNTLTTFVDPSVFVVEGTDGEIEIKKTVLRFDPDSSLRPPSHLGPGSYYRIVGVTSDNGRSRTITKSRKVVLLSAEECAERN